MEQSPSHSGTDYPSSKPLGFNSQHSQQLYDTKAGSTDFGTQANEPFHTSSNPKVVVNRPNSVTNQQANGQKRLNALYK
jgi:hypothetical protein